MAGTFISTTGAFTRIALLLLWGIRNSNVRALTSTTTNSRESASVEPYVASWCAKQFTDELPTFNGYRMALLRDNHVEIEPYLAQWCLAQFPSDLTWQDLNDQLHYLPFEDTLQHWAARSLAILDTSDRRLEPPVVDLVPYVGEWCRLQFTDRLQHLQLDMFGQLAANHAPLEPVVTEWCMAQFPIEIEAPAMMKGIDYSVSLEGELMQWSISTATVNHDNENCKSFQSQRDLGIVFLSLSLVFTLSTILFLVNRGKGGCIQSSSKEYDIDPTEIFGDQSSEGTTALSVEPC